MCSVGYYVNRKIVTRETKKPDMTCRAWFWIGESLGVELKLVTPYCATTDGICSAAFSVCALANTKTNSTKL
jgi:hypothetical protein